MQLDIEMSSYFKNELKILKFHSIEITILNHYIIEEYYNGGNLDQLLKWKIK